MFQDKSPPRGRAAARAFFWPAPSGADRDAGTHAITIRPPRLARKLAWVMVIKSLALMLIWWAFLAGQRVDVDAEQASRHLLWPSTDSRKDLLWPSTDSRKEQGDDF